VWASEEDLVPRYFELRFGGKPDREADGASQTEYLVLSSPEGGEVLISGRMDRVDVARDGKSGLVIDYKTRGIPAPGEFKQGLILQAPLYALALRQVFGMEPLGAEYRSVSLGSRKGIYASAISDYAPGLRSVVNWEDAISQAEGRACHYANQIRNGRIAVEPVDCDEYCPYSQICRIDPWELARLQAAQAASSAEESSDES